MLANSPLFTLEPRDAMLVRDGRAMNANVGRSLPFPHPSSLAGLVRTRLGSDAAGRFDEARAAALLTEVSVAGPLLARLSADGNRIAEVLARGPADCIWYEDDAGNKVGRRLLPRPTGDIVPGGRSDLGDATELLDHADPQPRGKWKRGPAFWSWVSLLAWLERPSDPLPVADVSGVDAFERELRVHVSIDPATGAAEDGALFGTESVRLCVAGTEKDAEGKPTKVRRFDRYALLGAWSGTGTLARGVVQLGGERRPAFLERVPSDARPALGCPPSTAARKGGKRARVVLLTPAVFAAGSFPASIAGAEVIAAKVDAPDVVSGWDFARNAPKPTRRLAPAGSVYWVEVPDDGWAARTWLTCVGDDEQAKRDGFGLAVVGVP